MTAHSTTDVGRMHDPENIMFEMGWKPTSQIFPTPLFEGFSGKFGDDAVFTYRGGKCFMRRYVVPRDPKTASQLRKRDHMRRVTAAWIAVGPELRKQWQNWARRYGHNPFSGSHPHGQNVYTGAVLTTGMMGLPAPTSAPNGAPPPPVTSIMQQSATGGDDCFAFRVNHGIRNLCGKRLLIEVTDEMPTLRRRPHKPDFRLWSADDAASFVPLKADGEVYVLEGAQFAVRPGKRYGVRMTVVTEQGIRSHALKTDFIKSSEQTENAPSDDLEEQILDPALPITTTQFATRSTQPAPPQRVMYDPIRLYSRFNRACEKLLYPNGPPQRAKRRKR